MGRGVVAVRRRHEPKLERHVSEAWARSQTARRAVVSPQGCLAERECSCRGLSWTGRTGSGGPPYFLSLVESDLLSIHSPTA